MSRRRHSSKSHINQERWLITYSDLITLLMIFFVVMYASSQIDTAKFQTLAVSLSQAMANQSLIDLNGSAVGGMNSGAVSPNAGSTSQKTMTPADQQRLQSLSEETKRLQELKQKLETYVQQNGLQNKIDVNQTEESVQITMRDVALFDTGKADLKPEAVKTLGDIVPMLQGMKNSITIEGYTDNVPIHNAQFASNWELSSARALTVLHFFEQRGIQPARMSAIAYGEFRPVAPNDTAENRSKNRRVNVVVHRLQESSGGQAKP